MRPLFLGSHPAVDFLNTALAPQGTPIETIGDGRAFVDWLVTAGLLDRATAFDGGAPLRHKSLGRDRGGSTPGPRVGAGLAVTLANRSPGWLSGRDHRVEQVARAGSNPAGGNRGGRGSESGREPVHRNRECARWPGGGADRGLGHARAAVATQALYRSGMHPMVSGPHEGTPATVLQYNGVWQPGESVGLQEASAGRVIAIQGVLGVPHRLIALSHNSSHRGLAPTASSAACDRP